VPDLIADTLILTMPANRSLADWDARGTLDRESALLRGLRETYGRTIIVTHGGEGDAGIAQRMCPNADAWLTVVPVGETSDAPISGDLSTIVTTARATARVIDAVRSAGGETVVVQTMQLDDGGLARGLVPALRSAGLTTALVARGGYLPSRVFAAELGPHSDAARHAGRTEARVLRRADVVVGPSHRMLDELTWRHGVDPACTKVIPDFVLESEEPPTADQRDPATLLTCCPLIPMKRIDHLIGGLAGLPEEQRVDARLDVVGDGPLQAELGRLATDQGVRVNFLGRVPHAELRELMRRATIYVMGSEFETHPRTLVEAMAEGLPAVVADSPGLADRVENGVTGVVVPGSPEGFSYALAGILTDPDWRDMLGATAAARVHATCGLDRVLDKTRRAHAAALARARAHRAGGAVGGRAA
jgi:glycosyltransferase involved in cell wall biosynthesis